MENSGATADAVKETGVAATGFPPKEFLEALSRTATIPHIYFNGFTVAQGTGDITLVLQRNGQPSCIVNCSFTVAKTLSTLMGDAIKNLESISGQPILTTEDIARLITEKKDVDRK